MLYLADVYPPVSHQLMNPSQRVLSYVDFSLIHKLSTDILWM